MALRAAGGVEGFNSSDDDGDDGTSWDSMFVPRNRQQQQQQQQQLQQQAQPPPRNNNNNEPLAASEKQNDDLRLSPAMMPSMMSTLAMNQEPAQRHSEGAFQLLRPSGGRNNNKNATTPPRQRHNKNEGGNHKLSPRRKHNNATTSPKSRPQRHNEWDKGIINSLPTPRSPPRNPVVWDSNFVRQPTTTTESSSSSSSHKQQQQTKRMNRENRKGRMPNSTNNNSNHARTGEAESNIPSRPMDIFDEKHVATRHSGGGGGQHEEEAIRVSASSASTAATTTTATTQTVLQKAKIDGTRRPGGNSRSTQGHLPQDGITPLRTSQLRDTTMTNNKNDHHNSSGQNNNNNNNNTNNNHALSPTQMQHVEDRKTRNLARRNNNIGSTSSDDDHNIATYRTSRFLTDEADSVQQGQEATRGDNNGGDINHDNEVPGAFAFSQDAGFVRRVKGDMTDAPSLGSAPISENPLHMPLGDMPFVPGIKEDSQNSWWTRPKLLGLMLVLLIIIVGAIVGTILVVTGDDDDGPVSSTISPTASPIIPEPDEYIAWRETLKRWTEESVLMDESSPQYMAMAWLANEDNLNKNGRLDNRYALATLFFATGGWEGWSNSTGFLGFNLAECDWNFVTCDDGNITRLEIVGNSLQGTLPDEFGILDNLQYLDLSENSLSGSISAKITRAWTHLQELSLSGNSLTGRVPSIGPSMRKFFVDNNAFSGSLLLPPVMDISAIPLSQLNVSGNMLSGTLPERLGDLQNLERLALANNHFNGTLPEGKDWPALQILDCQVNTLTGTVPVADMTQLQVFLCGHNDLDDNSISFDAFPQSIGLIEFQSANLASTLDGIERLSELRVLVLSNNELSGTIPPEIGILSELSQLKLGTNFLSGSLPPELGTLTDLGLLELHENDFTGTIPTELSALSKLESATFDFNDFDEEADVEFLCSIAELGTLYGPDCQASTVCSCCERCG